MEKMRKNAPLLRFINRPSLAFSGGIEVKKDSEFEEVIEYEFDNGQAEVKDEEGNVIQEAKEATVITVKNVTQVLKDLVLTTTVKEKQVFPIEVGSELRPVTIEEESVFVVTIPEEARIIYQENEGYILPAGVQTTLEEGIAGLELLKKRTELTERVVEDDTEEEDVEDDLI